MRRHDRASDCGGFVRGRRESRRCGFEMGEVEIVFRSTGVEREMATAAELSFVSKFSLFHSLSFSFLERDQESITHPSCCAWPA